MKKAMFVILIGMLIIGFGFVGMVAAQGKPVIAAEIYNMLEESNLEQDNEFLLLCSGDMEHPVLKSLADFYEEVDYDVLLVYFCEQEFGVGEIRLALTTAEREDVDLTYDQILDMRLEAGMKQVGWGRIWHELGLIGRFRQNRGAENLNDDHEIGVVCTDDMDHPVLMSLAERYEEVAYTDLLDYFCEQEFGIGEIRLALITAEREDVAGTYKDILNMRNGDGMKEVGWGLIWQELGLIGRGKHTQDQSMGSDGINNRPVVPPGLGGDHPGKGVGPRK